MIDIFCTKNSLDFIFSESIRLSSPDIKYGNDDITKINSRIIISLMDLLYRKSKLVIDISKEEMVRLSDNTFYKYLIKQSMSGGSEICDSGFDETIASECFTDYPCAIYLLDKSLNECLNLEARFGQLFLCKENLFEKIRFLFSLDVIPVGANAEITKTLRNWGDFSRYKHPCNSMVFIDNRFWNNSYDVGKLAPFLKSILPNEISDKNTDFHLTIITYEENVQSESSKKTQVKKFEEELNDHLNLPYKIQVSIIRHNVLGKNHDRNIITNYVWFHSGHTLDYFKEERVNNYGSEKKVKTQRTTSLFVSGIAFNSISFESSQNWVIWGYKQVRDRAKEWYTEDKSNQNLNRLL